MAITLEWIKNMTLRNKLAAVYTSAFTIILGITFISIYIISDRYREEQFYKKLSDRTLTTFKISVQVDQIDNALLKIFDNNRINSLGNEEIVLFDSADRLIYSSADSVNAAYYETVLKKLKGEENVFEQSEDKYDLLGMRFKDKNRTYYGIARAYDEFGKRKIRFLGLLLSATFLIVAAIITLLSVFLSQIITRPITQLTSEIEEISPSDLSNRVQMISTNDEIGFLSGKFNELLNKVENAFKFQSHYIHHLSHELKTPLAVMMANAERSLAENESEKIKVSMQFQKNAIMDLSNIIDILLDISKNEKEISRAQLETIRMDEIIFECIDEVTLLNPDIRFDLYMDTGLNEKNLIVKGNSRMIKMVMINLVKNAVNFSSEENPAIEITSLSTRVQIRLLNDGPLIEDTEQNMLFRHSFRGKNSVSVKGFGLGLVLAYRIVKIHHGVLTYSVDGERNCFTLQLPIERDI